MKRVYLMGMIEWSLWNRTYLRKYVDASSSHSGLFTTESGNNEKGPEKLYIPWQDAVVPLAYYHIIDNLIHVILYALLLGF
jgi:hypothetical protein